jgi:Protein of unknown function (DUF3300)
MRCSIDQRYRALSITLAVSFLISTSPLAGLACGEESTSSSNPESQTASATKGASGQTAVGSPGPAPGEATPEELEELVSPIALYPDLLVARILVASTFPTQIVEAQRWLEQNPNLKGDQFAEAVNAQPWDPSVRSLAQFRDVLKTMNDSLSWTSALGEAYYNQPDDVMDAIQRLRNRAVKAGTLKDTPQQKIETKAAAPEPAEGGGASAGGVEQTVVIEPAQQNTVYVPQYDPTTAYGAPVAAPAGYGAPAGYTGTEMLTTGLLSFGAGMGLMALINDGDDDWDCGWDGSGGNNVNYNKNVYTNRGNNYPRSAQGQARQGSRQARRDTRQAGRNPGATPYAGAGRGGGATRPTARPYNAASARPYRPGGPGGGKPTFPKASTLPANAGLGGGTSAAGRGVGAGGRGAGQEALSNQRQNRAQQQRGYGANTPNRSTRGGRTGAFGGYGSGGRAQAAGNRGRSSLGGRGGGGGGRRGGGGGGGGRRGGGGGGRGRR